MSKRKKSYNNFYNHGLNSNLYSNQYLYTPMMQYDNFCNMFNNDFRNIYTLMSLISDGFDINKFDNFNYKDMENGTYINQIIINFFLALKPILGIEIGNIIDKFIEFYMNEINNIENG